MGLVPQLPAQSTVLECSHQCCPSNAPVEAAATHAPKQQQGGTLALASRLLIGKGSAITSLHAPTSFGDYASSDFNNIDYDVAVERYENDYVKQVLKADIEQSSNRFTDYEERPNNGVLLPTGNVESSDCFGGH